MIVIYSVVVINPKRDVEEKKVSYELAKDRNVRITLCYMYWIPNSCVPGSKPMGDLSINAALHLSV